jgi:hypothetical protein
VSMTAKMTYKQTPRFESINHTTIPKYDGLNHRLTDPQENGGHLRPPPPIRIELSHRAGLADQRVPLPFGEVFDECDDLRPLFRGVGWGTSAREVAGSICAARLSTLARSECPVVRPSIGRSSCDGLQTSWRYPLALLPPLVAQSLRVADVGSA